MTKSDALRAIVEVLDTATHQANNPIVEVYRTHIDAQVDVELDDGTVFRLTIEEQR